MLFQKGGSEKPRESAMDDVRVQKDSDFKQLWLK